MNAQFPTPNSPSRVLLVAAFSVALFAPVASAQTPPDFSGVYYPYTPPRGGGPGPARGGQPPAGAQRGAPRVELGAQSYSFDAKVGGKESIAMGVLLQPGANALETGDAIRARLEELSADFPASIVVCVPKITATLAGSARSSRSSSETPVSTMPFTGIVARWKNGVSGSSTESVLHAT